MLIHCLCDHIAGALLDAETQAGTYIDDRLPNHSPQSHHTLIIRSASALWRGLKMVVSFNQLKRIRPMGLYSSPLLILMALGAYIADSFCFSHEHSGAYTAHPAYLMITPLLIYLSH
jgi:hypothetical protein